MTRTNLKKLYDKTTLEIFDKCGSESMSNERIFYTMVYTKMFGEFPHLICLASEGFYLNEDADDFELNIEPENEDEYFEEEEPDMWRFENIFSQKSLCNIVKAFTEKNEAYIIRKSEYPIIIAEKLIVFWDQYYREIYILQDREELREDIADLIVDKKNDEEHRWFSYVTTTSQGFNETPLKCKKQDVDIETNYNDDLPHERIVDFLKSTQSGLVLLHGEAGTGKSSYIRHLMYEIKGRHFMVMDSSVFNYISDASFIDLLLNNRNAVVILEDCETMLADRVTTGNQLLTTLLNLSDGIIGDGLNFKFICTFNAEIGKLDKALMRKGRMKINYKFEKLTVDKTKVLAKKLGKQVKEGESLTLADIYNYGEDNGAPKQGKKIGFAK